MNLLLANSFTTFFNNLFLNWKLVLFIVLTILLILSIFFKRFKTAFFVLIASSVLIGGIWLGFFINDAVKSENVYELIEMAVAWGPTILFSLTVVFSTLINAKRGRRKSLVLWTQSALAAVLWFLLYYFGVKSKQIDAALVKFVNLFMGENGVQNALGVSENATTFRNILTLYFESLGGSGVVGTLLSDTTAYVYTLADMVYHIAFASVCYLLYLLTVFILYIVYLCFYSERKHKKKKAKAFSENNSTPYKKHRIAGGFVGLARGIVSGVLGISFIGACLFMVAGRGEGKLKDYEIGGKYETHLKIYRALESYGTQGIFMILNAMSDPADMPYYLFAADLVFSGELDDELNGVTEEVNLRAELGEFTGLARDTVILLVKYGEGEIGNAVNGTSETGLMQAVLNVMKIGGFQNEFDALIAEYNSPTFVHNFCMSLVSSLLGNLDKISIGSSLSDMNKELLKIMFKGGYLSRSIPEDKALIEYNERTKPDDAGNDFDPQITTGRNVRPYIGLQQLVGKEDLRRFMNIFFTVLSDKSEGRQTFDMIRSVLPKVQELSLFENGKSKSVDPVLARLYCYLQNSYLNAGGVETYSYNALLGENVAWTDEIGTLLDVAEDIFTVYDDVKDAESAVFNRILYIFDKDNPNREKDIKLYDKIEVKISASRILGKTLASGYFRQTLSDGLSELFDNFYIPKDIVYENTFSADGSVKTYGELHYFLKGLKNIGDREDQSFFELIFSGEEEDAGTIIAVIAEVMEKPDVDGRNFAYYASRSDLLRSLISRFLTEGGEGVLYVPNAAYDTDENGKPINVVTGNELEVILNGMGTLSEFVNACVDGNYYEHIDEFLEYGSGFMNLIEDSRIAEGSLALLVKEKLCNMSGNFEEQDGQNIIVPQYLNDDVENWCSPKNGGYGELKKFISSYLAVRNLTKNDDGSYALNLKNLMENKDDLLLETVAELGKDEDSSAIEVFLSSDIIHYTVSDYLNSSISINGLTVIVPFSAQKMLYDDVLNSVIKKEELYLLFSSVSKLDIVDSDPNDATPDASATQLLKQLILNQALIKGELLSASVVVNLVNNATFVSALRLTDNNVTVKDGSDVTYFQVGQGEYLRTGHYSKNPWCEELPKLLNALNALFGEEIEKDESFVLSSVKFAETIQNAIGDDSKIKACYDSRILRQAYKIPKPSLSDPSEPSGALEE